MNDRAFTLVELLAVFVILGIIALISSSGITGALNVSKDKAFERQKEVIESAAERWAIDNMDIVSSKDKISIDELKSEGYLNKKEDIVDPRNKKKMTGCVFIIKTDSEYKYEYRDVCV